ncbi:hypothetical protein SLEP1_g12718 [Rubroshorea leprosula]|uniref:Uncharacterized protein n=1 Tax=Rubroshorea leprosula TaxID=152421 RepID=A0AAV5IN77_9ROSI|nr:hypothetical protein SLEP1_g12718 [Rubroshorea leprosula]
MIPMKMDMVHLVVVAMAMVGVVATGIWVCNLRKSI